LLLRLQPPVVDARSPAREIEAVFQRCPVPPEGLSGWMAVTWSV
jgi:hypothetical protein